MEDPSGDDTRFENTTVFVGNLDASITEDQLKDHFSHHGTITQIKIPPGRGCGFVKFETHDVGFFSGKE